MNNATIGLLCYLAHDKNMDVKAKNDLYNEAKSWKMRKHLAKADICFELYNESKDKIAAKTELIKQVAKATQAKPVYGSDYSIVGIEAKSGTHYKTVAATPKQIQELAELYLVEAFILGNKGELSVITESKK